MHQYLNLDTNAMRQSLAAVTRLSPSDPLLWVFHGWLLARCNGWAVAYPSMVTADELAQQAWPERHRNRLLFERTSALRAGSKFQTKHTADFVQECRARFWSIPPRDPATPAGCLDLTTFYQVSLDYAWLLYRLGPLDLKTFPCGRSKVDGVEFDARGVVQLSSRSLEASGWPWPKEIRGIPVVQSCRRLHFLHATDVAVDPGTAVGGYRVRFADGQEQEIPIVYGRDLEAWFEEKAAGAQLLKPAWQLRAPGTLRFQLYHTTWENPRPSVVLESLDFFSTMTEAAPFLIAVTAEP